MNTNNDTPVATPDPNIKIIHLGAAARGWTTAYTAPPPTPAPTPTHAHIAHIAPPPPPQYELSPEQKLALIKYREGHNIFITGPGGTGKSFILREIINSSNETGHTLQVCAMTGRAAVLLNCKARTIHSWTGLRLARGPSEDIVKKAVGRSVVMKNWRKIKTLVIDEVSMMSLKIIEILNDIGKCARKNFTAPFGGVQVVFIGDFFQLPPIGGMDEPTASQYCFESSLWGETFTKENHIKLTQIFRQKGDNRFIKILSQVREGRISRSSHELLISMIGKTYQGEMVPTKLFPLRASADNLNARTFALIDSPVFTYEFEVKTDNTTYLDDGSPIPYEIMKECGRLLPEYVNNEIQNLVEMSPCSSTLLLKVGAVVMLCYNLNVEIGLCNGSQGVVVGFSTAAAPPDTEFTPTPVTGVRFPLVRFTNGITTVITQQYYQSLNYPTISFSQIPLKLAWGLTIHSSQGATLDMAEIDIGSGVFEVGQTYVALSRVKSLDGLYLLGYDPTKIKVSRKVIDFYQTF